MPKYLFVYHGGEPPKSADEAKTVMAKWNSWLDGLGEAAVDRGNPAGPSKTVYADKVADTGGANPASGYSLIEAADMDNAIAKSKGCPIFEAGGTIEIAEAVKI